MLSGMFSSDFEAGMADAMVKRAQFSGENGLLMALNAAANIKGLSDITNRKLEKSMADDQPQKPASRKKTAPRKLKMSIDPELLRTLTPEQRKSLFFAVRRIRPNV